MPEPVSLRDALGGYGDGTAVSPEAETIRRSVSVAMESIHLSIALFGSRTEAVSEVLAVAAKHSQSDWNCEGPDPVSEIAIDRAIAFIHALPGSVPVPEVPPGPSCSISLPSSSPPRRTLSL